MKKNQNITDADTIRMHKSIEELSEDAVLIICETPKKFVVYAPKSNDLESVDGMKQLRYDSSGSLISDVIAITNKKNFYRVWPEIWNTRREDKPAHYQGALSS